MQPLPFPISDKEDIMKFQDLITLCAAVAVGLVLIAAPAIAVDMTKEKALMNDSWLTAKTKIALFADPRIKGGQIDVESTAGQVMIRGKVDSIVAKHAAEDIAKGINGVKSVKNDLEVVTPSTRQDVQAEDTAITASIKERITKDKDARLEKAGIGIQTNAGVVSLTGEVPDIITSAHASWTARQVPGVKSVKNDLTLKEKQ
jgi:hyperosmotically inducible protein